MARAAAMKVVVIIMLCLISQVQCEQYVVAQDGTGNFITISDAVNAIPFQSQERYIIHIKEGIYEEYVVIPQEKINVEFVGDGAYRTRISGNRSVGGGFGTLYTATVAVKGDGFIARDITFENVAGPTMHQAVALVSAAEHIVFYRCIFIGLQDTLYVKQGIQFFSYCEIHGTVDFIFGNAAVVFQNCLILVHRPPEGEQNTIIANDREEPAEHTGIVIHHCNIKAAPDLLQHPEVRTYMGRPWGMYSRTIIMESTLDALIDPNGWLEWEAKSIDNAFYAEFQNDGPGANTAQRVGWAKKTIDIALARTFTVCNYIWGNSTWIPSDVPFIPGLLCDQIMAQGTRVGNVDTLLLLLLAFAVFI